MGAWREKDRKRKEFRTSKDLVYAVSSGEPRTPQRVRRSKVRKPRKTRSSQCAVPDGFREPF